MEDVEPAFKPNAETRVASTIETPVKATVEATVQVTVQITVQMSQRPPVFRRRAQKTFSTQCQVCSRTWGTVGR